ncbi:MAG TPA: TIM barrel protein [Baekduia sp.]|uniref:TIM barrel protein n=1 Tax=Baekduia sp. TaxID=2600305 RepID=UPI002D79E933|nr:TIM barrel protein [Baekduia sp.]HET6509360.1 TIM barrel protein [Baekduia sp.]
MMPLSALNETRPLLAHHPIGASTGFMADERGDWPALVDAAAELSPFTAELAALSELELPGLLAYLLSAGDELPAFRYLSVHAPSKGLKLAEPKLVDSLQRLPATVDAIVVHPDVIDDPGEYRRLGARLVIENMDTRKGAGRTADELAPLLAELPDAGLCLDVAHARDVDASMDGAHALLDRFADRLRHLHVSSLDDAGHHVPLTVEDEAAFGPVLRRCRDVPWILEAPLSA